MTESSVVDGWEPAGYHLGVDLGTSFTAAAIERDGVVTMVELGRQRPQIPTVVHIDAEGELVVGDAAERRAVSDPEGIARDFKRRLGDQVGTMVRAQLWSAESLLAAVLSHVLAAVTASEGGAPAGVTLSHPAHWGPYKLELLREVARLAGVPDARFVSEPAAAALHATAGAKARAGRPVVVYDLGGGTFDVSMVRTAPAGGTTDPTGELIGRPDGLERLGGIDFDEALRQLVEQLTGTALSALDTGDAATLRGVAQLRADLVAAKEALSVETSAEVPLFIPGLPPVVRITRQELEAAIELRIADTMAVTARLIDAAGLDHADRSALSVLLVGGSSRIPLVGRMVAEHLALPTAIDEHPKHPVALGAARHARALAAAPTTPANATATETAGDDEGAALGLEAAAPSADRAAGGAIAAWWRRPATAALAGAAAVVVAVAALVVLLSGGDRPGDVALAAKPVQDATGTTSGPAPATPTTTAPTTATTAETTTTTAPSPAASVTVPVADGSAPAASPTAPPAVIVVSGGAPTANSASGTPTGRATTGDGTSTGGGAGGGTVTPTPTPTPTPNAVADTAPAPTQPPAPAPTYDPAALTAGRYQEGSATYSVGWNTCSGQLGQDGGCDMWTSTPGRSYTITFRGTGIVVYGAKAFNGGMMDITVDGGYAARADSYFDANPNRRLDTQEYYRITGLPYGDHTLQATMAGDRNPANTQPTIYVTLDRFDVLG